MRGTPERNIFALAAQAIYWLALLAPLLLIMPGCGGCQADDPATAAKKKKDKEAEEKKKKAEKPKDPFESQPFVVEPGEGKATSNVVKPGHWVTASQAFKSNDGDILGEFQSSAVDQAGHTFEMDHAPFRLIMTRSASLPKGQTKHFDFLYYTPRRFEGQNKGTRLQSKLYTRGGGRLLHDKGDEATTRMPAYQYHLLVLSADPDRYGYFKRLESINPIGDDLGDQEPLLYYRVSLPKLDKRIPLPRHALAWTSVAYIFWDGIDPALLSQEQQDGLVDWLHWGGQLVINGPESLDTLRASFLGPYLPAEKVQSINLEQEAFAELNKHWSLTDKKNVVRNIEVVPGKPPVGIEMKLLEGAAYVPQTGELVAERRVGRGRIAVTSFSLTSRTIVNWASLDNFFNGAILRRPPRIYVIPPNSNGLDPPEQQWMDNYNRTDPRLISTLRYFSHDVGYMTGTQQTIVRPVNKIGPRDESQPIGPAPIRPPSSEIHPDIVDWHFDGYGYDGEHQSGVAGWSDFCAASDAARESLTKAAGVSIPKAGFVLRVIAVYLLVLVPLNWVLFRLMGRVEYAWIAAPAIAIVGAIAVVKLAQLDIGFVRSQTEVAILELHNGHTRGHATRYTALYSSLTTTYDLAFDDPHAVAQPFPKKPRVITNLFDQETPTTCFLRRDEGVTLTNFTVRSASTEFTHSEQMLNVGGGLKLVGNATQGYSVDNQTDFTIRDAAVLRCIPQESRYRASGIPPKNPEPDREYLVAYIGELSPKTLKTLTWDPIDLKQTGGALHPKQWRDSAVMTTPASAGAEISLSRLVELATRQIRLDPGDFRLLGWMDENLPGMTVEPRASQLKSRTLVLAHLQEAPLPLPLSDKNLRISLIDEDKKEDETDPGVPPPPEGIK